MSSCLGGGGAAYSFELEMMKSPPSRPASHNTPSPSSTISESNSPPLAISTRKPRTRRKRPNQTHDEAAALLSTAYPNIFSFKRKTLSNPLFLGIVSPLSEYDEASQLLLPFDSIEQPDFLINPAMHTKPDCFFEHKDFNFTPEIDDSEVTRFGILDDFDAGSILYEEVGEGIDSFMGNIQSHDGENRGNGESGFSGRNRQRIGREMMMNPWYGGSSTGFGPAGKFQPGLGLRSALRVNDYSNWCEFPTVEFEQISPRIQTTTIAAESNAVDNSNSETTATAAGNKLKKKKKKVDLATEELKSSEEPNSNSKPEQSVSPMLKLDYGGVLEAWADKESPFSDEILGSDAAGIDVHARLAEIDLLGENGMREASVLRYKEKRRNRLFSNSKKIRYQVRKLNADQRPRMKGRFVRRPNIRNLNGLRL